MYRKIVVGYDDTEQAKDALAMGRQIADATGAALIAARVVAIDSMWAGVDAHLGDHDAHFPRRRGKRAPHTTPQARARAEQLAGARPS
jgi:nucleotide-binding universal stress UspA family protein